MRRMGLLHRSVIVCAVFIACVWGGKQADKVTSLPGLSSMPSFDMYAGYITIDAKAGRNLFYWFVQSQNNPNTDPLFLWMQGGPGCSSLLGFFTEHGPFQVVPGTTKLTANPYSWNKYANILYLESPAGVGFSYDASGNYTTGDNRTSADAYAFLQQWFGNFPEYSKQDFYISGESYGGHYVPQLAYTVLQNSRNSSNLHINLKGILVGNPWTDDVMDTNALPPFVFYHHLCSLETWQALVAACNLSSTTDTLLTHDTTFVDYRRMGRRVRGKEQTCDEATDQMYDDIGNNTNQYDIYTPCVSGNGLDCIDYSDLINYLNTPAVQQSLHAKKPAQPWDVCADLPYEESWASVVPIYPYLMDNLHVTVYGGDVTYNVPVLGTEVWVQSLGRPIVSAWKPWNINSQVAGYYIQYKGITLVTVKDSGHMVPYYTPVSGAYLFQQYIRGVF